MLSCREVTALCSQELDRPLGLRERLALRTHLMMCRGCSRFRAQMGTMHNMFRRYAAGEMPGDEHLPGDTRN
ncbi:zf-HC2 domain-containing protein [Rubrivivax albus]|uniref:Zf-HC2 domain-containing protein n=1 Tax=Rubrivivax albus TaxID=2499835 RepID=A0A437JRQ1_9BURK|nr:zf-HC2 domain-containing protein [Rubrivivax albus]RVT49620.1 zf-HC2 domain-containing protein [Rubrivivax albus]